MPDPSSSDIFKKLSSIVALWWEATHALQTKGGLGYVLGPGVLSTAVMHQITTPPTPAPFETGVLASLLEDLVASDPHLRATCRAGLILARVLELLLLEELATWPLAATPNPDLVDQIATHLMGRLFEADYRRRAYFRVYNLSVEESPVELSPLATTLDVLPEHDIPRITGERTPTSTLHLPRTGNAFLVFEDQGPEDDNEWWSGRWEDALVVVSVLKYLKYGVVDIDYSVLHFSPEWVNQVRRYGIAMWGRPRTDVQELPFILTTADGHTLLHYLTTVLRHRQALEDLKPSLRQATATAGTYYEAHHGRTTAEDQLVDLSIALEALFSPSQQTELRFRIAQTAALLLGNNPNERKDIAAFLRRVYDTRSALVHGGVSPFKAGKLSQGDVRRLGDIVREAVLRLVILYVRGSKDKKALLEIIEGCALDPSGLEDIRRKSDVTVFLQELGS